ncbi:MAG: T9SS type A sorting domain-containing protein, partial [Flavobacteriales bacterium]
TVVGFNDQATQEFDGEYDAYKFYAVDVTIPSIAAIPDTEVPERHAISMVPVPEEELIIPLEIKPGDQTDLMISNVHVDSFDDNICMILEDKELNSFTPFNEGDEYPFIMSDTSSINRFVLHVSAPLDVISFDESCPDTDNGTIIAQGFGEGPWNFVWKDEMEVVIQETLGSTVPDQMTDLTPGFYLVEVSNNNPACNAATKVVQVQAAPEVTVEVFTERATCNQEETGSIELELGNNYEWNIEIQDDNYNEVHVADDATGTLVVNGLNPEVYHVVAIASCGLEMGIEPVDLSDAAAVEADFTLEQTSYMVGESIFITNNSENATAQLWNFGDGFSDTLNENPVYQYEEAGIYSIELTASNGSCQDSTTVEVTISEREDDIVDEDNTGSTGTVGLAGLNDTLDGKEQIQNELLDVNFTAEQIMITAKTTVAEQVKITVYSISGQIVIQEYRDAIDANLIQLNTSGLAPGVFYLNISTQEEVIHAEKFINS